VGLTVSVEDFDNLGSIAIIRNSATYSGLSLYTLKRGFTKAL